MKKKKIVIVGHFDSKGKSASGAVVKCNELYNALKKYYPGYNLSGVDIYAWRRNVLSVFLQLSKSFFCSDVVVIVGSNTSKWLMSYMFILKKVFKSRIVMTVVGASIVDSLKLHENRLKGLKAIDYFFVETEDCVEDFKSLGILNSKILRNFKDIEPVCRPQYYSHDEKRFVLFSRITKQKGISDAIEAVEEINNSYTKCCLDIYGPIDEEYKNEFDELINTSKSCSYKGIINAKESVEILRNYYALLFPTRYETEGIPGTLIDAFAAGLPIISSDFPRRKYVFDDMVEGIVYEFKSLDKLKEAIQFSITNEKSFSLMRINSLHAFPKYSPPMALEPLIDFIERRF